MTKDKYVYDFSEGKADMKELLGGKGANLAEMTSLGIPVPFGFTITTAIASVFKYDFAARIMSSLLTPFIFS